jgi:hypothetical protein
VGSALTAAPTATACPTACRTVMCAYGGSAARYGSAARCGRAAARGVSIRLLLLCPLRTLRAHSVIDAAREPWQEVRMQRLLRAPYAYVSSAGILILLATRRTLACASGSTPPIGPIRGSDKQPQRRRRSHATKSDHIIPKITLRSDPVSFSSEARVTDSDIRATKSKNPPRRKRLIDFG